MKKISIIIPTLNESEYILQTLQNLQSLKHKGHEIILVDGGSTDDTTILAKPYVNQIINCSRGRAIQMNRGAAAAVGQILLFLHADTELPQNADQLIELGLQEGSSSWGRFDVRLSSSFWMFNIIALFINLRSRLTKIATGDQAIFVTQTEFHTVGGYPEIELMEDIALSQQLSRHSKPLCLRSKVTTSSRRWENQGITRTVLKMWLFRLAYFIGIDPQKLVKHY